MTRFYIYSYFSECDPGSRYELYEGVAHIAATRTIDNMENIRRADVSLRWSVYQLSVIFENHCWMTDIFIRSALWRYAVYLHQVNQTAAELASRQKYHVVVMLNRRQQTLRLWSISQLDYISYM